MGFPQKMLNLDFNFYELVCAYPSFCWMCHFYFFCLCQITKWQKCLKFPEEPKISNEAKDLICRLLCDVDTRLGTRGVEEIKVPHL